MSKIKSNNTKPELAVRKILTQHKLRYRLHLNSLPGKPDIVLSKYKTVIFVNGCFWHGHKCKIGSGNRIPTSHSEYWSQKLERNVKRDDKNISILINKGWQIIIVWECQTKNEQELLTTLEPLLGVKKLW